MAPATLLKLFVGLAVIAARDSTLARGQQEDPAAEAGAAMLRQAAATAAGGGSGGAGPASGFGAARGKTARARAIGATDAATRERGVVPDDGAQQEQQDQARPAPSSSSSSSAAAAATRRRPAPSSSSSSSAAAATRRERLRTAAAGTGSATPSEDYSYIPLDGRVLLRPRSVSKLRDYTADLYGGVNEVAQAQPFFSAASIAGRVGVAARYSLDYNDYLSPRQINSRIGPSSHVATAATARAQGAGGVKMATDSVATRRASYRLDLADSNLFEASDVGQLLNAASAGATIERDQANDPFYTAVPDVGPGLVGRRRRVE